MTTNHKTKGFSLIELLIVVAIILVVIALSMRYLMQAYMAANEGSAINSIRALTTAQQIYAETYRDIGYADSLAKLGPGSPPSENGAGLIDSRVAGGTKSGYEFSVSGGGEDYFVLAKPVTDGRTGTRWFCTDFTGTIRGEKGKCDLNSPPVPK